MAQATSKACSVPGCCCYSQKQPYLSFHSFPVHGEVRRRWIQAIRREEGPDFTIQTGSTYVCSRHFTLDDYVLGMSSPFSITILRLKADAVPSLFPWNDFTPGGKMDRAEIKKALYDALKREHDYATPLPAGMLDGTVEYIEYLEAQLKNALRPPSSDLFGRYCASDDQMRFYTRFPSERVFRIFWESIAPSASRLLSWTEAQRIGEGSGDLLASPSPPSTLPLIDEFLIYCMQVAVGAKEQVIADTFRIRLTAVSRVTITWANYLYFLLGALPLWASREKVKAAMPGKFKKCCPDVRVILDCAEIPAAAAATASSSRSRASSRCRNGTTFKPYFKGLIGVAPHGLVTFFSPLYAGSVSDEEMTKVSGVLPLLEPGDEVVAGEGFGIGELLSGVGAKLVAAPVERSARSGITREDGEKTQAVARLRTVAGRVIGRIKSNHIWDSPVPPALMGTVRQIWHNCCVMVNFQGPLSLDED
ncbi:hypothetical protein PFLUV_G00259240 [Perca fluviatilis]|uniref:THAP-type domain-containing protein n=1 Tax=Perca fluviatilis TaxID=8168 RepID=A0A6A5EBD6_PERFL|nr:hypothetical protein PFLUV_G00259240 [Perca fluviatilis]